MTFGLASCGSSDIASDQETINIKVKTEKGIQVALKSELDTINPPRIQFFESVYNFGEIKKGEVITHEYEFKNTGNSPLIIIDAKASCGCTIPSIPDTPIAPGGIGKIRVKFNSKNKYDKQSKTIRISANTYPERITRIVLEGYVKN